LLNKGTAGAAVGSREDGARKYWNQTARAVLHRLSRISLAGGTANSDILEGGLIVVVAVSLASVGPSVWSQHAELLREQVLQLLLAALAVGLCIVERSFAPRSGAPSIAALRVERLSASH
jgi:hypothetical protein